MTWQLPTIRFLNRLWCLQVCLERSLIFYLIIYLQWESDKDITRKKTSYLWKFSCGQFHITCADVLYFSSLVCRQNESITFNRMIRENYCSLFTFFSPVCSLYTKISFLSLISFPENISFISLCPTCKKNLLWTPSFYMEP